MFIDCVSLAAIEAASNRLIPVGRSQPSVKIRGVMQLRHFIARMLAEASRFTPRRLRLPLHYFASFTGRTIEPELRYLESICRRGNVAIDIGAHEGLFSYRLVKLFRSVYAFEINGDLVDKLASWNPGNVTINSVGLSSHAQEATLYIPIAHGMPLTGWGSLAPGNCPEAEGEKEKRVRLETLDSFQLRGVGFIKIDVEGHEAQVLQGARETIASSRPIVLLEVKEENRAFVANFFSALNYRATTLQQLSDVEGSPENQIYIPERLDSR